MADEEDSLAKKVHQQKPDSPVPSYVSMRSDQSHDGLIDFKHGHHSTDQRVHQQKPDSPVPSCVSMSSDQSHDGLIDFKHGHHSTDQRVHQQKPDSPVPSYVSMRSDQSHDGLIDFKHGHHSTDQRVHQQKPDSPVPSCVSMSSDQSHDGLIDFKHGHHSTDQRVHQQKPDSPAPSCVSMSSDQSHDGLIDFKHGHHSTDQRVHQQKPDSPVPSCVSMRSDQSHDGLIDFRHHSTDQRVHQQKPDSPVPSYVSMRSDQSHDGLIDFKHGHHSTDQRVHQQKTDSPVPSCVSMSSDQSHDGLIDFKHGHHSTDQSSSSPERQVSSSHGHQSTDETPPLKEGLSITESRQQNQVSSSNVSMKVAPTGLRTIQQKSEDPKSQPAQADKSDRKSLECRKQLSSSIRKKLNQEICHTEDPNHPNQKNTEHIIRVGSGEELNKGHEMGTILVKSISDMFQAGENGPIRTVLTMGDAGIGKTFLVQRSILEWARGETKKDAGILDKISDKVSSFWSNIFGKDKVKEGTDLIFPLILSKLHFKEDLSLVGLLNHFFEQTKKFVISNYAEVDVMFILDGLDQCQLPLDFDNNPNLTDIRKPAPVDVILTNLIKGNLLPSARLWITSRPEAAHKISDAVGRFTEIREKPDVASQRKLKSFLTKQFRCVFEGLFKHTKSALLIDIYTDLYIIEGGTGHVSAQHEVRQIQEAAFKPEETPILYYDIFKPRFGQEIRTVLTNGVAGIGKTIASQKYMLDWAEGKSNEESYYIFPFLFRELNLKKEEQYSLEGLIHEFFPGMKTSEISHYDKYKLTIILDGLDQCQLPLNFNNPDLTDIREPASMDMLLTNLIKGKLLPSARLWIISRPAATDKIPLQYIHTVTECRESLERRKQLSSSIREKLNQEICHTEDPNHPNQKNTEHIIRVGSGEELNKDHEMGTILVMSISDMFQAGKNGPIRTVLTMGDAGIGKTFLVQRSILEWARGETKKDAGILDKISDKISSVWSNFFGKDKTKEGTDLIFPLTVSKLHFKEDLSLVGLLNHFFEQTKKFVISNYAEVDVMFIIDSLDQCQLPLDFDNNPVLTDIRKPAPVDVILTNLIKGKLLPSARLWITSRPEAAHKISDAVGRFTEIREKPDVASQRKLKSFLTKQFHRVFEGLFKHTKSALLNEIFTDLYIIEGGTGDVNPQHEVRQIQEAAFKPEETPILYYDIFKPRSGQEIRTVLTNGVAGIGKTIASQKYMLDWAEGKSNEESYYIFPFLFRELNLKKEEQYSLEGLIHEFIPGMKTSEISNYDKYNILLVLDGLDEWKYDLNFNSDICTDVKAITSVNVLLVNLIKHNLLPTARLWITSRPAASSRIPLQYIDLVTEVRGFTDPQKEEYFRKRFSDKLANEIISHLTKSRTLHILCHIPVFCWITATVLEGMLSTDENRERTKQGEMPKALTDMFIHFLVLQCRQANEKYHKTDASNKSHNAEMDDSCWNSGNVSLVLALGKLAFEELEKGNLVFVEEDLKNRGIDLKEAAVYSGLFTQISRDEYLFQSKMYGFVHLSIQEFLAALYRFLEFSNEDLYRESDPAYTFYKCAVDKALGSSNGDWDLFLRFLLGLLLETNQKHLHGLLKQTVERRHNPKLEIIEYIKEKIRSEFNADRSMNLFHCLNELGDNSLVEEIITFLSSDNAPFKEFSSSQWSALTYVLLTSNEKLDVFDLKKYLKSEHVLLGMLPVVKVAKIALLSRCDLSQESCKGLASSILCNSSANLTELNLSDNDLLDKGIKELSEGLRMPQCKLKILKLSGCQVTEKGCNFLGSALKSNPKHLRELDLSYNHPGDFLTAVLTAVSNDPLSALETLRLDHGGEHRIKPGLLKYAVDMNDLTLDWINTANQKLVLSEGNRKVRWKTKEEEKIPWTQVLCEPGLKPERCYWEVEVRGTVGIGVAYRRVNRGWDSGGGLGSNAASWSLIYSEEKQKCKARHDAETIAVSVPSQRIGVFLDWEGGTLEYYSVSEGTLTHIHTFQAQFTEPLYPGFWIKKGSIMIYDHPGDSGVSTAIKKDPLLGLETLRLDHGGEHRLKPGWLKYAVDMNDLTLDWINSANQKLVLSEGNRKATKVEEKIQYPWTQVLCEPGLKPERCYWEVEVRGTVGIDVAYRRVNRGWDSGGGLGSNATSWSLIYSEEKQKCKARHDAETIAVSVPSQRIGVFLDWEGGTLEYYSVSEGTLTHIHTFQAQFTEPLYPGFWIKKGSIMIYDHPSDSGVSTAIKKDPLLGLETLRLDHGGEHRLKPGWFKYAVDMNDLSLDWINTANQKLVLSEGNRKATKVEEKIQYPWTQVLCEPGLKPERCYWEVEVRGTVGIDVAYRRVNRGWDSGGGLGSNATSWSLIYSEEKQKFKARHDAETIAVSVPSQRIGVFLDWEGGTLEYYSVSEGTLTHIHTFQAQFTEPLYPGFWIKKGSIMIYDHPSDSGVSTAIKKDPLLGLETLRLDHGGEHRLKPGWFKYAVDMNDLTLDWINTANQKLVLSEGNRKARWKTKVEEKMQYPWTQVLCEPGLKPERCYWEVEVRGTVGIDVAYRRVNRGWDSGGGLGSNATSWSLIYSEEKQKCKARHDAETIAVSVPSQRIGVFLDWEGGTLEYYSVSEGTLTHIHTFQAQFTEPLYPGFWIKKGSIMIYDHPGDSGVSTAIKKDPLLGLETLRLDHGGENRLKPGWLKYAVDLTLDIKTASQKLVLSEGNRKARRKTKVNEKVHYPDHPDRFRRTQVLCEQGLTGRCYWEVELTGDVGIAVAYQRVNRDWDSSGGLGSNAVSWSLICSEEESKCTSHKTVKSDKSREYIAWHDTETTIAVSVPSKKIAVFLDWEVGTLEYYSASEGTLTHIHTFQAQFTEPLYPGFWIKKGSVSLCQVCKHDSLAIST